MPNRVVDTVGYALHMAQQGLGHDSSWQGNIRKETGNESD